MSFTSPWVAHVGRADQHSAIEQNFERPNAHPIIANAGRPISVRCAVFMPLFSLIRTTYHPISSTPHRPSSERAPSIRVQLTRTVNSPDFAKSRKQIDRFRFRAPFADARDALLIVERVKIFHRIALFGWRRLEAEETHLQQVAPHCATGRSVRRFSSPFTISPGVGFGVSRVMPETSSAFEFAIETGPEFQCTGLFGAASSSSALVGKRPSSIRVA